MNALETWYSIILIILEVSNIWITLFGNGDCYLCLKYYGCLYINFTKFPSVTSVIRAQYWGEFNWRLETSLNNHIYSTQIKVMQISLSIAFCKMWYIFRRGLGCYYYRVKWTHVWNTCFLVMINIWTNFVATGQLSNTHFHQWNWKYPTKPRCTLFM